MVQSMSRVIVSGEYPHIANQLRKLGLSVITTSANPYIAEAVAFHPDMQVLALPRKTFVLAGSEYLAEKLNRSVLFTEHPGRQYPKDVLCNGKWIGNTLFCNSKTIDKTILSHCESAGIRIVNVHQGYTGCSICEVDGRSIITSDKSIALKAKENNFDVLLIREGHIELPGYDYGFIGGCSGKICGNQLIFSGDLSNHPDYELITSFIKNKKIEIIQLPNAGLLDIGGIVSVG